MQEADMKASFIYKITPLDRFASRHNNGILQKSLLRGNWRKAKFVTGSVSGARRVKMTKTRRGSSWLVVTGAK